VIFLEKRSFKRKEYYQAAMSSYKMRLKPPSLTGETAIPTMERPNDIFVGRGGGSTNIYSDVSLKGRRGRAGRKVSCKNWAEQVKMKRRKRTLLGGLKGGCCLRCRQISKGVSLGGAETFGKGGGRGTRQKGGCHAISPPPVRGGPRIDWSWGNDFTRRPFKTDIHFTWK